MTEHRIKSGVQQARDLCKQCGRIVNPWARATRLPLAVLIERTRTCPHCGKESGVRGIY